MASVARSPNAEIIDELVALAANRLPAEQRAETQRYIRQYYRRVPLEDLRRRSTEDLYFAALAMLNFHRVRRAHEDKLEVYNPTVEEHGWSSSHTVIDLVTGDRPFLVDSLTAVLSTQDIPLHFVVRPTMILRRDSDGYLTELFDPDDVPDDVAYEAVLRFEVARHAEQADLDALKSQLRNVIGDVRMVVEDWQPILGVLDGVIDDLEQLRPRKAAGELEESIAFLRWLVDNHFTFLGYRCFDLVERQGRARWKAADQPGFGILRNVTGWTDGGQELGDEVLPPDVLAELREPNALMITKSDQRATVHRAVHIDSITVKRFSKTGKVIGAHRILGLFTSAAYNRSPRDIPFLRQKVSLCIARAGFSPGSHDGKALLNILETYPRDELFQIGDDQLLSASIGILQLEERPRLRLFIRRDTFERFISCLIFVPRDRYDTNLRLHFGAVLEQTFDGTVTAFYTHLSDAPLARLHMIVRTTPGAIPAYNAGEIEGRLIAVTRGWEDNLHDALIAAHDERRASHLQQRYGPAFPAGYRDRFSARQAVSDIEHVERAVASGGLALSLYRPAEMTGSGARFKIYNAGGAVPLSDVLPMLENMGLKVLDEFPYQIVPADGTTESWIHDFGVVDQTGAELNISDIKTKFEDNFAQIWSGAVEDDGFNQLVARAGLTCRQVVILRAYCKYLRQAKIAFSQEYMERALATNPKLAGMLVALFEARFDPVQDEVAGKLIDSLPDLIEKALEDVSSLDDDRIIRRFLNIIQATLRTNFYQAGSDGAPHSYVAFKIDSAQVDELPLPRPMVEIFVYSARMEGVHLRGGKVARGGLRWSDRPEDFRTEILGLMKAQMVKNSVIVPVGSKGGFVCKRLPAGGDRDAVMAEVVDCYKTLIGGMLDITDNLVGGEIVRPDGVTRYDDDDPYLVVAADKGTATFSDIANGVSESYGFWLGDAFASGGSEGYDHKKMGITARGAWESVKRHFRELGTDIQNEPFTVIGVGDMSGDVFGNGMLLSEHIKLVGAFNHLHIFLDPDPDPASSFAERQRLFELPRSGWTDYNERLISKGGGIFDRRAKSIKLSAEVRELLDVTARVMTPIELIAAMLRAPVDLLWNGGIGTYAKASHENHAEVGDRTNDSLRADANELRCRVIGEGGNLGFTQPARIEAAQAGVRVNTDAIDNSAGVDCSDHEVNIKILLGDIEGAGDMTRKQRNQLLRKMTDAVGDQCLRDNYLQTQGITVIEATGHVRLELQARMMQALERDGILDRTIEFLPDPEQIGERLAAKAGLTRPEISVLFAYAKNALYDQLLESDLADDKYLDNELLSYFPGQVRKKYAGQIRAHRLRREIIATQVANSMVNRASMVFPMMAQEETGQSAGDVARAYVVTRDAFQLRAHWDAIEALDNKVPSSLQTEMILELRRLMEHCSLWFLRNQPQPLNCTQMVARFGPGIDELMNELDTVLPETWLMELQDRAHRLEEGGVPEALARLIGGVEALFSACDIVEVATQSKLTVGQAANTYFELGEHLSLDWLRRRANQINAESYWQRQAVSAIVDDLYGQQRALTARVIRSAGDGTDPVATWAEANADIVSRNEALFAELGTANTLDLAMLAVANRQVRSWFTV